MTVRLINKSKQNTLWLKDDGKAHVVLGITFSMSLGRSEYLLWSEAQLSIGLYQSKDFKDECSELSRHWQVSHDDIGNCQIYPLAWSEDSFWDKYNDGDHNAENIFKFWKKELELESQKKESEK